MGQTWVVVAQSQCSLAARTVRILRQRLPPHRQCRPTLGTQRATKWSLMARLRRRIRRRAMRRRRARAKTDAADADLCVQTASASADLRWCDSVADQARGYCASSSLSFCDWPPGHRADFLEARLEPPLFLALWRGSLCWIAHEDVQLRSVV